jgi:dTDP-4-dehydrorhamnose 3,5-epimerase
MNISSEFSSETEIVGCFVIQLFHSSDDRGSFAKFFNKSFFKAIGMSIDVAETYITNSSKGVLRGMHFQLPPHEHDKIVTCVSGSILDVFIDLRRNSPTYLRSGSIHLWSAAPKALFLPRGIAHGFLSLEENTRCLYSVSSEYSASYDSGVHWASINFNWPEKSPIVSARDSSLPDLDNFDSPFFL